MELIGGFTAQHLNRWLDSKVREQEAIPAVFVTMARHYLTDRDYYSDAGWQRLYDDSGAADVEQKETARIQAERDKWASES